VVVETEPLEAKKELAPRLRAIVQSDNKRRRGSKTGFWWIWRGSYLRFQNVAALKINV